ncbi:MAG TPA: thiamine-phosphate kinase [Nocardioidaceae bacterium]|nr:thiamine-phosphate kinase [Nocardioidaceae bacterium]
MTPAHPPVTPAPDATLADLGEFGLVTALKARFPQGEHVLLGPGDDAAVVAVPDGRVVVSTDLLVDTRHFRRDWASALDIGHKAAAQNLSDINAMGGRATALTVGLAAPPELSVAWALELADGIAEEAALVDASVVGGDLTRADEVMIAITVLGVCEGEPVLRSGARPGDIVAIAGRQGWAAAGLAVLTRGFRSPRVLVEAHRRPEPPYAAGAQAAALGATAMIDLSDGLLADVGHIAEDSGVAIDVLSDRFEVAEPLRAVGAALGADPMQFILTGGDDHALVATFPAGTTLPAEWTQIGEVSEGEGVTVDGAAYEGPTGHQHFA